MTLTQKVSNDTDDKAIISRYRRAESFEHEMCVESMVLNAQIYPHWIEDSHYFWYVRKCRKDDQKSGVATKEYRVFDADTGANLEAFNHESFACALAQVAKRKVEPDNLPITQLALQLSPREASFAAFGKCWRYYESSGVCKEVPTNPLSWLISPDGKKAVFLRDYNLWIRNIEAGTEKALTEDGERYFAYGVQPERMSLSAGLGSASWVNSATPEALWSDDSTRLFTVKVDERKVLSLPLTQYVAKDKSVRPKSINTRYALPRDENIAEYRMLSIDVESMDICEAQYPPVQDAVLYAGLFTGNRAWWSKTCSEAYFIDMERGQQEVRLISFDTNSGVCRELFKECSATHIDLSLEFERPALLLPLPKTNELIWFSERSGWAHLYLYDLITGELKRPITAGSWMVRDILFFNAERRELLIQIAGRIEGRDPYYREICRVNIDSGAITTIASGDYDCLVCKPTYANVGCAIEFGKATSQCSGISAFGEYIVLARTRADEPPITELIDVEGNYLFTIEDTDLSGLPDGWQWPEPVKIVAADGKTDIYGLVFRPSNFSPDKQYPVLNWAFNNPFYAIVPKGAFGCDILGGFAYYSAQAYAELGFITVMIDGRGSCYRSKEFHDHSYGMTHIGSDLNDHVTGINQLAERYSYIDIDRVGIADVGGSNAPVYGLLAFPEFYKVGAVCSVWDPRLLNSAETYQGMLPDADYDQSVLENMAGNLKGKLLLMHGMLDPYFHVSGFFRLVAALIDQNKDFDLVVLPNGGHSWDSNHYGLRRIWDYLVQNLQGIRPPSDFRLSNGFEYALDKIRKETAGE